MGKEKDRVSQCFDPSQPLGIISGLKRDRVRGLVVFPIMHKCGYVCTDFSFDAHVRPLRHVDAHILSMIQMINSMSESKVQKAKPCLPYNQTPICSACWF